LRNRSAAGILKLVKMPAATRWDTASPLAGGAVGVSAGGSGMTGRTNLGERPIVQDFRFVKNYRTRFAECGTAAHDGELGKGLFAAEAKLLFEIRARRLAAERSGLCCDP
jgi:hypothetical protein